MIAIAIYHMSAKVVSRGAGRSAVAASAYLSCSRMYNDYDGIQHDYTRKHGLAHQEVLLPPMAPSEWQDREILWNAVEQAEKTKDSRLAREFVVALPIELSRESQITFLRDFIQKNFVDLGMCADFAIHDTDGHNPHAHILLTVRPLEADGSWQYKTQKEYLCIRNGEEKGFTAAEFKTAQQEGWEKQYAYKVGKKKIYMTTSAAQKEGYVRADKHPKSTRFGRQNPISEQWNSETQLREWRKAWADAINQTLEIHQIDARVDHRSFADQGRLEQPTIHEGYHARNMEKHGFSSDRCEINRQIRSDNRLLRELKKQVAKLTSVVMDNIRSIADALEKLRGTMILLQYQLLHNRSKASSVREWIEHFTPVLSRYKGLTRKIKEKRAEKKTHTAEKKTLNLLQPVRYYQISQKITTLTEEIEELLSQKERLIFDNYFHSEAEFKKSESVCRKQQDFLNRLDQQYETLSVQLKDCQERFQKLKVSVSPEKSYELLEARSELREAVHEQTRFTLQEKFGQKYDSFRFHYAANAVDDRLKEDPDIFREYAFRKRMEKATIRRQDRSTDRVKRHKEPER